MFFGRAGLDPLLGHPNFCAREGDIRDTGLVDSVLKAGAYDRVIHLAAISNDPSSELDPAITESVNVTATRHLIESARRWGVERFIFASSASVYGVTEEPAVHEELPTHPITLYAQSKVEGEHILEEFSDSSFETVVVRSATVCGYSPRLRLDLTVNIFACQAICDRVIKVFGGSQRRPNIHLEDLTDFYLLTLDTAAAGNKYNVVHSNASVNNLAEMVRDRVGPGIPIETLPTNDPRSYHLSCRKAEGIGFTARRPLVVAVDDLCRAFGCGLVPEPQSSHYRNVVRMKQHLDFWRRSAS